MKKKILLTAVAAVLSCAAFADPSADVLYLKNGTMMTGSIVELKPHETVKIKADDGNIYVYQMRDVARVTDGSEFAPTNDNDYNNDDYSEEEDNEVRIKYPTDGYRGWCEFSVGGSTEDNGYEDYGSVFSIATVHGAQIRPNLFIGGGLSYSNTSYFEDSDWEYDDYHYHYDEDDWINHNYVTFFADARMDFIKSKISPFLDCRVGYSVGEIHGFYASPSFGVRFNRASLALGYEAQLHQEDGASRDEWFNLSNVMFRVSVEFGGRK